MRYGDQAWRTPDTSANAQPWTGPLASSESASAVERLSAASGLRLVPADCVAVEDSHWGLESARAAGMRTIAITHTYPRESLTGSADAVVSSLAELTREFIARL